MGRDWCGYAPCIRSRVLHAFTTRLMTTTPPAPTQKIRAVIFDLDGTLIDSNALHVAAWVGGLAEHTVHVSPDAVRPLVGMGGDQLLPALLGREIDDRHGDAMREAVGGALRALVDAGRVSVFGGAVSLLEELRRQGVLLAIATSAAEQDLEGLMRNLVRHGEPDLRTLVDVVITRSDVGQSKPAPDLVTVACDRLRLPPSSCLFVGDTEYDMQAASRAAVRAVGVLSSGLAPRAELRRRLEKAGAAALWSGVDAMWRALTMAEPAQLLRGDEATEG